MVYMCSNAGVLVSHVSGRKILPFPGSAYRGHRTFPGDREGSKSLLLHIPAPRITRAWRKGTTSLNDQGRGFEPCPDETISSFPLPSVSCIEGSLK